MLLTNVRCIKGKSNPHKSGRGGGEIKVWLYCCDKLRHIARECQNQKEEEGDDEGKDKDQEGNTHVNAEDEDSYDNVGDFFSLQEVLLKR